MDIEKLIERLKQKDGLWCSVPTGENLIADAATALSTLQAENEKLRNEVERQRRSADDRKHLYENAERAYMKVVAELEQVKRERDAVVESIPHECKTCVYHTVFFNGCTLDHDCTNPDGGCSNNYDRWRWRGIKED